MIRKAFKYRLKDKRRLDVLKRTCGCCRLVWNKALALQKERLDAGEKFLSYPELCSELAGWKSSEDFSFLNEANAQGLQQTLKHLRRAIADGLDPRQPLKRFPTFKKKGKCRESFHIPAAPRMDGNRVFIPKVGWCPFWKSREIVGKPRNFTVSLENGHWHFSVQVETDAVKADPGDEKPPVGIDMGCVTTATLSSNERHEIPKTGIMLLEKEARKLQKKLSRQQRFGSNWHKTKSKVAKVHSKISRIRHDWLQKTTTEITKNHGIVCVEDLSVRNMTASARGTAENPGRNVRQKAGLNRSILRNSWGEFVRQIAYKLEWSGGTMVKVPAPHTSQKCSSCGHTDQKNRTEQSKFSCVRCGFEEHADVNAAKNILEAGLSLLGDMGRHEAA